MNDEKNEITVKVPLGLEVSLKGDAARLVAKAIGVPLDAIYDVTGDIWGGLVGQKLKAWRLKNTVNVFEQTAAKLNERGIDLEKLRTLSNAEMLALFDGSSKEDDRNIQDLWASLLANSLAPNGEAFDRKFVSVLTNMASGEARTFKLIVELHQTALTFYDETRDVDSFEDRHQFQSILDTTCEKAQSAVTKADIAGHEQTYLMDLRSAGLVNIYGPPTSEVDPFDLKNHSTAGARESNYADAGILAKKLNEITSEAQRAVSLESNFTPLTFFKGGDYFNLTCSTTYLGHRLAKACNLR